MTMSRVYTYDIPEDGAAALREIMLRFSQTWGDLCMIAMMRDAFKDKSFFGSDIDQFAMYMFDQAFSNRISRMVVVQYSDDFEVAFDLSPSLSSTNITPELIRYLSKVLKKAYVPFKAIDI